ncbi:uncharacterized protein LOC141644307 [Silene latifolia]|uniref:uncharacterized protein LOC141644307 n=1 Tax=Silene latifolia TaxID=37657 RepID=UPI003D778830
MDNTPLFVDESFRWAYVDSDSPCIEQIEGTLRRDDVPGFVELINNLPSQLLEQKLDWIHSLIFLWNSGKCAAAVLDGQTKITEIHRATAWLSKIDNGPMHYAAGTTAFKITALLLQRGFSADTRADCDHLASGKLKNVLPLHAVMSRLRFDLLRSVNPKEELSAITIVIQLCEQHMRWSLETLRLIAQNTTEVKREFFNYLKEGKTIEVGALLLVAKSQIFSPSITAKGEGEFRSMSEMLDFVLNTKNNKLVEMKETLVLLEIFNKIGDKLATLLRLDFTPTCQRDCSALLAGSLIEDAGFDVKAKYLDVYYSWTADEPNIVKLTHEDYIYNTRTRVTDMLPNWIKEAALRRLDDKSGSTSHLTYPFLAEARPYMTPGSAFPMLEYMTPLHHLLKKMDDTPLFIDETYRKGNISGIDSDDKFRRQIEKPIILEDVPGFVELINNLPSHLLYQELNEIRSLIFYWDSSKCAAAVLDGQTKITEIPRVTAWLSQVDNGTLHCAVESCAFKITALLLQRGFSADVRKNALPLHSLISGLRFSLLMFVNPEEELSAVKIVVLLFNNHVLRLLETLRLIALNTTEVKREFFNYLNEGKTAEVAALLLVAKSKILSPSTSKAEGEFQSISEIHDFVYQNKLVEMETTLELLEIFDKIGDKLTTLLRLDFTPTCIHDCSELVAGSLIADAGFDVKPKYFDKYSVSHSWSLGMPANDILTTIKKCEGRTDTPDMLPSWITKAAFRRLDDESACTSRLTYPFLPEARPYVNNVSVSPLTLGPPSLMPENVTPLHHLLKKAAPFSGTIKKMFRRL